MDTDEMDVIDNGVDEKLNESFIAHASLADTAVPVAEHEVALTNGNCLRKEPKEGECYIFNYQEFKCLPPRNGSEKDAERLEHDFKQLNLDVHLYVNLLYEETYHVLSEASRKDYSKSKYFICCILTHGGDNGVLWAKDKKMNVDDILRIFSKSSSLEGLPKIFIIEACQGEKPELGISTDSTDSGISTDTEDYLDFLIVNSSYAGTVSFITSSENEAKSYGSHFIDELCCSLEEFSSRLDLLQILTVVNYRMANIFLSHLKNKTELDKKKQMPIFYTTLKEKVDFRRNIEPFVTKDTQSFHERKKRHGSGRDSVKDLQSKRYHIEEAKRILFLSIVDKNIGKEDSWLRSAIDLGAYFASRNYSRKAFGGNFIKSKILQFLDQSSNQSGTKNEFKAKKSSEVDCLICYVVAYSRNDSVLDAGGRKISKKGIVEKFIGQQNKSFVGKPKIFIFLLRKLHEDENLPREKFSETVEPSKALGISTETRGRHFQLGTDSVDRETDQSIDSIDGEFNTNYESTDGGYIGENLIPIHADILEICITVSDWEQIIKPMDLFQEILEKSPTEDLLSLLTEFNHELVEKHDFFQQPKQSFSMTSTLTKTLCLP